LGQTCFKLFETLGDLLGAKFASLLLTSLPLGEETLISQALLQDDRVDLDVGIVNPVLVFLYQQAIMHLLEAESGLSLLGGVLITMLTENFEDLRKFIL
jgi:hypothetical protein